MRTVGVWSAGTKAFKLPVPFVRLAVARHAPADLPQPERLPWLIGVATGLAVLAPVGS